MERDEWGRGEATCQSAMNHLLLPGCISDHEERTALRCTNASVRMQCQIKGDDVIPGQRLGDKPFCNTPRRPNGRQKPLRGALYTSSGSSEREGGREVPPSLTWANCLLVQQNSKYPLNALKPLLKPLLKRNQLTQCTYNRITKTRTILAMAVKAQDEPILTRTLPEGSIAATYRDVTPRAPQWLPPAGWRARCCSPASFQIHFWVSRE